MNTLKNKMRNLGKKIRSNPPQRMSKIEENVKLTSFDDLPSQLTDQENSTH